MGVPKAATANGTNGTNGICREVKTYCCDNIMKVVKHLPRPTKPTKLTNPTDSAEKGHNLWQSFNTLMWSHNNSPWLFLQNPFVSLVSVALAMFLYSHVVLITIHCDYFCRVRWCPWFRRPWQCFSTLMLLLQRALVNIPRNTKSLRGNQGFQNYLKIK